MVRNKKNPEIKDTEIENIMGYDSIKSRLKFDISIFTEDWMRINKEDLKGIFNLMNECGLTAYFLHYYRQTKYIRYDILEKNTQSGEQTREWLENIVADLIWSGFGRQASTEYDHNRFEGFNKLIKWAKHVEPLTCINLSYADESKVASYTFFLQNFPRNNPKRHYGENQPTFYFRDRITR
ncbi:hypothetical protein JW756_03845 [Candidatus Woesearchaeota archaeon]|nr:hypothetical protein [Candidatus Woesearchaeota archaeon]